MSDACRPAASTRLPSSRTGPHPCCRRAALVRSRASCSWALVPPPLTAGDGGGAGESDRVGADVGAVLGRVVLLGSTVTVLTRAGVLPEVARVVLREVRAGTLVGTTVV